MLPEVPSMIVPPGFSKPRRSASSIIGDADAVFHRAARIQVVGLDVHLGLAVLGHAVQAHQRRVPDRFQNVVTEQASEKPFPLRAKLTGTPRALSSFSSPHVRGKITDLIYEIPDIY